MLMKNFIVTFYFKVDFYLLDSRDGITLIRFTINQTWKSKQEWKAECNAGDAQEPVSVDDILAP